MERGVGRRGEHLEGYCGRGRKQRRSFRRILWMVRKERITFRRIVWGVCEAGAGGRGERIEGWGREVVAKEHRKQRRTAGRTQ